MTGPRDTDDGYRKSKNEKTNTKSNLVMMHKPPAVTTCSPMPNERDDMMKTHRNPAQDDTNKKSERMEPPSCEIKKMTLAIGLIMIVFRKRLVIHNNQKRFMTDCGA